MLTNSLTMVDISTDDENKFMFCGTAYHTHLAMGYLSTNRFTAWRLNMITSKRGPISGPVSGILSTHIKTAVTP